MMFLKKIFNKFRGRGNTEFKRNQDGVPSASVLPPAPGRQSPTQISARDSPEPPLPASNLSDNDPRIAAANTKLETKGADHAHLVHFPQVAPPTAADAGARELQRVTESESLRDLSQKLWDDAYDSIEKDAEKLVIDYRIILAKVLVDKKLQGLKAEKGVDVSAIADDFLKTEYKTFEAKILAELKVSNGQKATGSSGTGASNILMWRKSLEAEIFDELKDRTKRQMHMETLVESGKNKFDKASKVTKAVGGFSKAILSFKPIVDPVVNGIPQAAPAALPWAGVCFGLQILSNPAAEAKSNLDGIAYVASRMRWYCNLNESLLDEGNIDPKKEPPTLLLKELRTKLVALYKAILLYQMKSVRYYYRSQPWNFVLQLGKADDWDATLQSVKDIEDDLQKDSEWYYKEDTKKSLHKFIERAGAMKAQLGDIGQTLKDFVTSQERLHQHDKAMKCLRDLRAGAVDSRDDMDRIENQKEDLLPDVYGWIIRTNQYAAFTNWDESGLPLTRLLWINGLAGRGKTMIMIGIIRNLLAQSAVLAPSLSYFFCQGTGTSRATVMLRSLIWMLLIQQPQLISHVQTSSENSGQILFDDFFALRRMFRNMLRDPALSPVYLIVDGLDECDTTEIERGMEKLLEIVSESIKASDKVKWLLCSRPEVDGLAELMNPDDGMTFVELSDEVLEAPVKAYIEQKLDSFKTLKGYGNTVLVALRKEVYDQAKSTFLWVALALKALKKVHGSRAIERLKEMPTDLRELYDHMMTRIEKAEIAEPEDCKKVLVATLLATRQLSLPEVAILADLPVDLAETAVEKCGSFLIFQKNTLNLIHQTAKEYLTDNFGKLEKAGIGEGHLNIARRSIEAMSFTLKQNNYNLQPGSKRQDLTPLDSDPLAGIQYSCVFWANHLCYTNDESADYKTTESEYKAALEFLEDHFLHWLEALGWMGKVPEGVNSLILLESTALTRNYHRLYTFVHDAKRFALHNRSAIETTPLQLYYSALTFTPRKSIIRKQFKKCVPILIKRKPKEKNWNAMLQTLEGHSSYVISVAFSPDGKTLASGSTDNTVRLWDAVTGAERQTLEGHSSYVRSVAFSPDGKTLASGSDDNTVRLWDAVTDAERQTLEGHSSWVMSVAFSPGGKTLASGSADNTVRLWDAVTGAERQTLEGHWSTVSSVAFSPDGKTLASGSYDTTVRLWDAVTGAERQTLRGHWSSVMSVAFSPDGKTLASGSTDHTVRLWDAVTGAERQTLEGHWAMVRSVAFWDNVTEAAPQSLQGNTSPQVILGVSKDWVTVNGQEMLWLPPDYRPIELAVYNGVIALGCSSGRIIFLQLQDNRKEGEEV